LNSVGKRLKRHDLFIRQTQSRVFGTLSPLFCCHFSRTARTIAAIPARIASGNFAQAIATAKKSSSVGIGEEGSGDAFTPPVSEITVFPLETSGFVEGSTPFARFQVFCSHVLLAITRFIFCLAVATLPPA
jgi:hypothetical protein